MSVCDNCWLNLRADTGNIDVGKVKEKREEFWGTRGGDAPNKIRGPCQSGRMQQRP